MPRAGPSCVWAPGDLSFICMSVSRIMTFILNVSQLAELSVAPCLALLFLSSHSPCRQTVSSKLNLHSTVLKLCQRWYTWDAFSLLLLSITSPSHTHLSSFSIFTGSQTPESPLFGSWAPTPAAVMSQRRGTLEPRTKVDWANTKTLFLSLTHTPSVFSTLFPPKTLLCLFYCFFHITVKQHTHTYTHTKTGKN